MVGENGAGKSTLIKILMGVHQPDSGVIKVNGEEVAFHSPVEAHRAGLATIYQEFTLIPTLSVRANIFLGREKSRKGILNNDYEQNNAASLFDKLGVRIKPESLVKELPVAEQQLVEIARALQAEAEILVMDEPTAALAPREVEALFVILKELAGRGIGIVLISHRLEEVFELADRVTVMRDGRTIKTSKTSDITRRQLIELMVGRSLEEEFPEKRHIPGEIRLEVYNLTGGRVKNLSLSARGGEVVGLAGLMGAGRTETARLIFGADNKESGEIRLDRKLVKIDSPRHAIRHGICLLTEDRKSQGLVLKLSARDNFALPNLHSWSRFGWIKQRRENYRFAERVGKLNIRISSPEQRAEDLSGGNQQKLLVARWLESNSQVIIFDEPTRGIDVGAKYEMYLLIDELASLGKVIIVISSELPEVLGICDRIIVMREGRITGEITDVRNARQEDIMSLAV